MAADDAGHAPPARRDSAPPRSRRGRSVRPRPAILRADRRRTLWEDAKNLPNLLTLGRILMIPAVLVLLARGSPRDCFWAAIVYSLAAITDMLDGWLARRQGLVS